MKRLRRFLALLLLTAVVAGSPLWVFDAHALGDLVAEECPLVVAGEPSFDGEPHHSPAAGQYCNHGCHVASHLLGQVCACLALPGPERLRARVSSDRTCLSAFQEPLDRPPLTPSYPVVP